MIKHWFQCKAAALMVLLFFYSFPTQADEGMWLLMHLKKMNYEDMQKKGLKLSAEDIYSVNNSSLKDAVASLGGFCTSEVVSPKGLLLTNHHCAYDAIQSHSAVGKDYLADGFWAKSLQDEIPTPGLTASFVVRMEDVTERINTALRDFDENQRPYAVEQIKQKIAAEAKEGTHYDAEVVSMFAGNEHYLFVKETFRDVRIVGAPPSSIGKFGGDTDNWMWPRHTGDFAVLRIYAGKDNKPADYSSENVPYQPKHFLPVSMKGIKEGDFAMVMGFPGTTERYKTSFGISLDQNQSNPARIKLRERKLQLMKADMDASPEVRIKYASKYAQVSNYYKYFIGQNEGLARLNTVGFKKQEEEIFQTWAAANQNKMYANVLPYIGEMYSEMERFNLSYIYLIEAAFGTELIPLGYGLSELYGMLSDKNMQKEAVNETLEKLREEAKSHFKDYNVATDQKITTALLKMYYDDIVKEQHPAIFQTVEKKFKGNFERYVAEVFAKSMLTSEARMNAFLNNPSAKALEQDPGFALTQSMLDNFFEKIRPTFGGASFGVDNAMKIYLQGLREMKADTHFYPDANSTLRLTYGTVRSYQPKDGVTYNHYTTLSGVMEKKNPKDEEFVVPARLSELYQKQDFGKYAVNGKVPLGFITDNDITGGNSGSPVINAHGELIGIAFDGNWEAMTGDLVYDGELKRCINVDIRYVLFVIDKFAGAGHLLEEMKIVYDEVPANAGK